MTSCGATDHGSSQWLTEGEIHAQNIATEKQKISICSVSDCAEKQDFVGFSNAQLNIFSRTFFIFCL